MEENIPVVLDDMHVLHDLSEHIQLIATVSLRFLVIVQLQTLLEEDLRDVYHAVQRGARHMLHCMQQLLLVQLELLQVLVQLPLRGVVHLNNQPTLIPEADDLHAELQELHHLNRLGSLTGVAALQPRISRQRQLQRRRLFGEVQHAVDQLPLLDTRLAAEELLPRSGGSTLAIPRRRSEKRSSLLDI